MTVSCIFARPKSCWWDVQQQQQHACILLLKAKQRFAMDAKCWPAGKITRLLYQWPSSPSSLAIRHMRRRDTRYRPTPGVVLSCQLMIPAANINRLTTDYSTSNIRPRRIIMARHETISAWFWITNSWLSTGGLLFFLRKPMAHRYGSPYTDSGQPPSGIRDGFGLACPCCTAAVWPGRLSRRVFDVLRALRSTAVP